MGRIESNRAAVPVDTFAIAELFAQEAHSSAQSARDVRDSSFETESILRDQAVQARERAAVFELAGGLTNAFSKIESGAVGIAGASGSEAEQKAAERGQKVIEGTGQLFSSLYTFGQKSAESDAARLDNRARVAQKTGEDAREVGAELRRIRDSQVDGLRKLIEEESRTRQQIIRG